MTYRDALREYQRISRSQQAKKAASVDTTVHAETQLFTAVPADTAQIRQSVTKSTPTAAEIPPQVVDLTLPPEVMKPITDYMQKLYAQAAKLLPPLPTMAALPSFSAESMMKNPLWTGITEAVKKAGGTIEIMN